MYRLSLNRQPLKKLEILISQLYCILAVHVWVSRTSTYFTSLQFTSQKSKNKTNVNYNLSLNLFCFQILIDICYVCNWYMSPKTQILNIFGKLHVFISSTYQSYGNDINYIWWFYLTGHLHLVVLIQTKEKETKERNNLG